MNEGGIVLLASNNPHKLTECRRLLAKSTVNLISAVDVGIQLNVDESGETFNENARLKAQAFSYETDLPVIADDSGLEVEALGGKPGVHSSRFEGLQSDSSRNTRLLEMLADTPVEGRRARFRCVIVAAQGGRLRVSVEGICVGLIAARCQGGFGFGYDPLFVPDGYTQTFGELGGEVKDRVGHRSRALMLLMKSPQFTSFLE